jgi:predicted GIY-YIG superfamily endonuclease
MTKIYILERNGIPFYVGKTLQRIKERFYTHKGKNKNSEIIEIDCVDDDEWRFWESWYIELFKSWGFKLENKNNGGGGRGPGWISPPERNAKIKASMKNHSQYYTDEVREKISNSNKGKLKPFTKEHQQNMLIAKRKQAKPLLMYDLDNNLIREWESKGQAAEWIKETKKKQGNLTSQIKDAILGRQKTAFGYKWKYK